MATSPSGKPVKARRIGDLQAVKNTFKHMLACEAYYHIRVEDPKGNEFHLLLTANELMRALERAYKNEEDLPVPGPLQDLLD